MTIMRPDGIDPHHRVTVLDVLENFFGETPTRAAVESLSIQSIDELGQHILQSAAITLHASTPDQTYYPGGFLAGHWQNSFAAEHLNLALLYYPYLLVHDPLADFFFADFDRIHPTRALRSIDSPATVQGGPTVWGLHNTYARLRDEPDQARLRLAALITSIVSLAPLIREGILILRPQWPTILERQEKMFVSVGADVRSARLQRIVDQARAEGTHLPTWDFLWGGNVHTGTGVALQDIPWINQHEFYYLAKSLAVSDQAGATFVPSTEVELALLQAKADQVSLKLSKAMQPIELLREVTRVLIPDLALSTESAIAVRTSEQNFDDWRRMIRTLARSAAGHTDAEIQGLVEDQLLPIRRRLEQATRRSAVLTRALKEQSATTVITASTGGGAALVSGAHPVVSVTAALGSGALHWIWKAYRPPTFGGSDAVIAALLRTPHAPR
jgi:hypothetical protein